MKTVQVLGRFGPKLPQIAEALLTRQMQAKPTIDNRRRWPLGSILLWASCFAAGMGLAVLLGL